MKTKQYNTCNAWGFGGSVGTEVEFPGGWVLRVGTACYRHLPCHRLAYAIRPDGRRFLDLHAREVRPEGMPAMVWQLAKVPERKLAAELDKLAKTL